MLLALQLLATLCAALFAGAAAYINIAEHPARMALETRFAALQWAPSYRRAPWLQAPLAVVSLVAGVGVWALGGGSAWLAPAVLLGAVVPFTFIVIMPTNHALLAPGRDLGSPQTRRLLQRWAALHSVRTALSLFAALIYLWLLGA